MARTMSIALIVLVIGCLTGCGNSDEKTVSGILAKKQELVRVLKGVTDKSSTEAAKPKIQALMADVKGLAPQMRVVGSPCATTKERPTA